MRIAVCDDDKIIREQIVSLIQEKGLDAEIICFESGEELIKENKDFEITFLDIEMNKLSGIDVAKHIRKEQEKRGKDKSLRCIIRMCEHVAASGGTPNPYSA